ncbi:DinB family protein [Puia dinghuensis]|uniref:DinB-like domain-containing protein n=1 Tax=Puia dinghuensis TaxID=1792502 RepID=A0A8J2UG69_9BACT|nr:DinB family protein [Puia dinghuensis]GGB11254.1 hypothetical protein GCM10011511_38560 [Puia dinghuensis]
MFLSASIRARLRYQHQTIRELIGHLTEQQLKRRINPDKWSAFENIAHLACYHPLFLHRIERIQREDTPSFESYVADTDPAFPGYVQQPLSGLLAGIDGHRQTILTLLEGMDEATLQRKGRHARYGLLTIPGWTEFFLLHEAHHLYTIFMLVQELQKDLAE